VDAVSAYWQSHSGQFASLGALQACISDVRRRLTSMRSSTTDVHRASAAAAREQQDSSSSTGSDD